MQSGIPFENLPEKKSDMYATNFLYSKNKCKVYLIFIKLSIQKKRSEKVEMRLGEKTDLNSKNLNLYFSPELLFR